MYKIQDLHKQKNLIIYSSVENASRIDEIYNAVLKQNIKLIIISERELAKIQDLKIHNLITYEEFMKGNTAPFKRIVEAQLINELISSSPYVFSRVEKLDTISTELYEKLNKIKKYKEENYYRCDGVVLSAIMSLSEDNNLYDENIHDVYLYCKKVLDELYFIDPLLGKINVYSSEDPIMLKILKDMLKYNKFKLNNNNYNLKIQ